MPLAPGRRGLAHRGAQTRPVGRRESTRRFRCLPWADGPTRPATHHQRPRAHSPRDQTSYLGRFHSPQYRVLPAPGLSTAGRMRRGLDDRKSLSQPRGKRTGICSANRPYIPLPSASVLFIIKRCYAAATKSRCSRASWNWESVMLLSNYRRMDSHLRTNDVAVRLLLNFR
jgi:hypothetical protein